MFPILGRLLFPVEEISLLILTGCTINLDPDSGRPTRTDTKSIDLDKSEMVRVVLKMGAGELNVRGGSAKLMDAEFNYNNPRLKPEVHYDGAGFRGHLQVEEPSGSFHGGSSKYRWDLRFNDEKPLDMEGHMRAGGGGGGRGDLNARPLRAGEVPRPEEIETCFGISFFAIST